VVVERGVQVEVRNNDGEDYIHGYFQVMPRPEPTPRKRDFPRE
jgi:hypothetical protein